MKRKIYIIPLIIILLSTITPLAAASIVVKEDFRFNTSDNNTTFVIGTDLTLNKWQVNSTHLWLDKNYGTAETTRYCIWVNSPDNVQFTVNRWFPSENSTAELHIDTPSSTNISLAVYSEWFSNASATGVVSYSFNPSNYTLNMVGNTDTDNTIIISATGYGTTIENPPTNEDVIITDMEGCGNWVFTETQYYHFQAEYSDLNGYETLDTTKLRFSDGENTVTAVYHDSTYTLETGNDVVRIKTGSTSSVSSTNLQVVYPIYFTRNIIDQYDVDIELWCNDTTGRSSGWETIATDYFNIYNLGGKSETESNGSASRISGGDIFDFQASANSWIESNITFRLLQHVKLLPLVQADLIESPEFTVLYGIDYCTIDDDWVEGWILNLTLNEFTTGSKRHANFTATWSSQGEVVKTENIFTYHALNNTGESTKLRFYIDLWFNRENGSKLAGGRVNAYQYPMTDDSNPWLRWLTGNDWGRDESLRKQSMYFENIKDDSGNIISTRQIKLVKVTSRLIVPSGSQEVKITDYDIFDLTIGNEPFTGVQTPVFDETVVPLMPQGGFLGGLWSAIAKLEKSIAESVGPYLLNFWTLFAGALDKVFAWLGYPQAFSNFIAWLQSLWGWMTTSFTNLLDFLGPTFTLISTFSTKMLNTMGTAFTIWGQFFTKSWGILDSARDYGVSIYELIRLDLWIQLAAILYPIFLFALWDKKGLDAMLNHLNMVLNIFLFFFSLFLGVIRLTLDLIGRIIESIPVVE